MIDKNRMNFSCILWFMVTRDVLKAFQIPLAYGSCNFENFQNFQNITRAHEMYSRSCDFLSVLQYLPRSINWYRQTVGGGGGGGGR